jgi:gluconokinase
LRKEGLFDIRPPFLSREKGRTAMNTAGLRSPYDKICGLVYFGRMLDKIRSVARGELPPEYSENYEKDFDQKCAMFLGVNYELLVNYVNEGLTDLAILQSCFGMGQRRSEGEIHMWNEFMRKRGWNDELSGTLENEKKKNAMLSRSEIQTMFQFIEADSGRLVNDNHTKTPRVRKRMAIAVREWPTGQVMDSSDSFERLGPSIARRRTHHLTRQAVSH